MDIGKIVLTLVWAFLCIVCAVVGFYGGLMLAGLGICAVPFTWQLVFGVVIIALIIPLIAGASLPRFWWIPALLFDILVSLPVLTKNLKGIMASLICIIVATNAARLGSYWGSKLKGRVKS